MTDATTAHDVAPSVAGAPPHATADMKFAVFSAGNEAALHLLETINYKTSSPILASDESTIGYQLSIPLSSHDSRSGRYRWQVGAGPSPDIVVKGICHCHYKPDILLCPPGKTPSSAAVRRFIKDIHASVCFHPQSGVLLLNTHSKLPIVYEQGGVDDADLKLEKSGKMSTCVLRRERNYLRFGPYRFVLEFVAKDRDLQTFNARLDKNLRRRYHNLRPSELLDFIPTTQPITSWNIWLHRNIPNATSITAGVNIHTGLPVAVKRMRNKANMRQYTHDRLRIAAQYINEPEKGVLGIIDTWCEHKTSPSCVFKKRRKGFRACQHTYYSMPLAECNFRNMPWAKVDIGLRILYFHQTLSGLAELHSQRVIHGNIAPETLLVMVDPQCPPRVDDNALRKRAVISLYMRRLENRDASICVAPEAWEDREVVDETKLDVWALAASWLFAFVRPPSNVKITKESYRALQKTLDTQREDGFIKEPFVTLLRRMLAWEPHDRPTAIEALADEAWESVSQTPSIEGERKRKNEEKMKGSGSSTKRVRWLSPDVDD